jgi:hypothetical protein
MTIYIIAVCPPELMQELIEKINTRVQVMNLDMGELHWILRVEMTYDHVVLPSS